MANKNNTVLYTGVTSDLERRVCEHKAGEGSAFTTKYKCTKLLYYEEYNTMYNAISREKQLKNWKREWKDALIKTMNPEFEDLAEDW